MTTDALTLPVPPSAPYEGASRGRRMRGWRASPAGPNEAATHSADLLRARCRDLARNSPLAAAVVRCWTSSLIGYGITPRTLSDNAEIKTKLSRLWTAWSRVADVAGGDFAGLQQLAVRAWIESGECFVRMYARLDDPQTPLQLQVLEADMCPSELWAATWPGLPAGNVIRSGIEIDPSGRRVAYWFYRQHPQDRGNGEINPQELVRIQAGEVAHLYEPLRPGQLRGVPLMAPVVTQLRNLDDFNDAVLERQKLANLFALFVTKPLPSGNTDVMTGTPVEGTLDAPMLGLEPGIAQELLPGEDVRFSEPPSAGTEYEPYLRRQILTLAAGVGLPYELVSGDVANVSDRSLRLSITEYRRTCEAKIYGVIVPRFLDPIRRKWADVAALAGQLTAADREAAVDVAWTAPAWAPLHPVQDLAAMKLAVDNGFRSRSDVIAALGYDAGEVDAERAADHQREAALGLIDADARLAEAEAEKAAAEAEAARHQAEAAAAKTAGTAAARSPEKPVASRRTKRAAVAK